METQAVELQAELRAKVFELGHVRMVLGEKEGLLGQANMQVELLQEKMQVGESLVTSRYPYLVI